jgi:hypothetical protein
MSIAAMRQALEFIESVHEGEYHSVISRDDIATALHAAIEQAEKAEPVAEVVELLKFGGMARNDYMVRSILPFKPIDTLPVGTKLYTQGDSK